MRVVSGLALGLVSLLSGCQWLPWSAPSPPPASLLRLQGELSRQGDELWLQPCHGTQRLRLSDAAQSGLADAVEQLQVDATQTLFADLGGQRRDDRYAIERLYRLQVEGPGCADTDFKRLVVRAAGHEPDWSVQVSPQGMVLQRPGAQPLALPYLEERMPDGSLSFSSEADGQRFELWLTPGRCSDSMSGALSHLQASLRLNREPPLTGCAALGGARH